jgi:hypothetical protein
MTQREFDIIHKALGYALRNSFITPREYDVAMNVFHKEHPECMNFIT